MKLRKIIFVLVLLLAISVAVGSAFAKKPLTTPDSVIWELTDTKVIQEAQRVEMKEGIYLTGFTIEAKARSKGGNVIPNGVFRLSLNAFSPYEDMGSQKAGFWYIQGAWTVTKKNADPEALKHKHNPEVVEGTLLAELPYNPTTGAGNWTGKAMIQMALTAGNWSRGEGTLSFADNLDGDLFLALEFWPGAK